MLYPSLTLQPKGLLLRYFVRTQALAIPGSPTDLSARVIVCATYLFLTSSHWSHIQMTVSSASRVDRRRLLGLSAIAVASIGGVATIARSTAHDDGHVGESATPSASPAASPVAVANLFVIETHDTYFTPKELTIPGGVDVTIKVVNMGLMQHDFTCEPLKLSSGRLNPGEEKEILVNARTGKFQFFCSVPGHKILGMVGILTVE